MRKGLGLPQFGPFAVPEYVTRVAVEAERLGFDSVWAGERVHAPGEPLTAYPGGDGRMPERFRASLDPLMTLTLAASATSRVRIGTSALNAPLHPPVALARQVAGIDQLSAGRLTLGVGLGWCRDEYECAGVPWRERGARLDETLDVLQTLFGPDPVEHHGRFWSVTSGWFQPKPVQQPAPPLFLGGFSSAAFRRIGARANGWLGVALPVEQLRSTLDTIRQYAEEAGQDPGSVQTSVRINPQGPVSSSGWLGDYIHSLAEIGVDEAFVDLQFAAEGIEDLLTMAGQVRDAFPASDAGTELD